MLVLGAFCLGRRPSEVIDAFAYSLKLATVKSLNSGPIVGRQAQTTLNELCIIVQYQTGAAKSDAFTC